MKILSWNVNGRAESALSRQLRALVGREADIVALQEVTAGSYAAWCAGLMQAGYAVVSTAGLLGAPYPNARIRRKYMNLTAARHLIVALPGLSFDDPERAQVAFPEKYLAARITVDGVQLDVHNAHLPPGSSRGVIKVEAFEAIRRRIDEATANPRILCGDFNTPASEDDASMTTWGPMDPRWDAAERSVLEHPELRDVYRETRRMGESFAVSHFTGRTARRYDHIYASSDLKTVACRYLASWLDERLSDHAAVEAELVP